MTQIIDPAKLKAAAEHLEWTLLQYPSEPVVRGLFTSLLPLIEDAKAERVTQTMDRIPCEYNFADGVYRSYENPNIEDAYYAFSAEMRGGRDEQEEQLIASVEAMRKAGNPGGSQP